MIASGFALRATRSNGIDVHIDNAGGPIADVCRALNRV
jgi:NADPH-dependent curcumin reductase CurA